MKAGLEEELCATKSAEKAIKMMALVVRFASSAIQAINLLEVFAGAATGLGLISHEILITEELKFSDADQKLLDKEHFVTNNHLSVTLLTGVLLGKTAQVTFLMIVE